MKSKDSEAKNVLFKFDASRVIKDKYSVSEKSSPNVIVFFEKGILKIQLI